MWKLIVILSFAAVAQSCRVIKANGVKSSRTDHPSHVLIEFYVSRNEKYWCSGVLVRANFVLTTKTCLREARFINIHVYAYKLRNDFESEREIFRIAGDAPSTFYSRTDFDGDNYLFDVALIRLPVTLNVAARNYTIAKIPINSETLEEGRIGESVGWGLLNMRDDNAAAIKQAQSMRVLSDADCRAAFPGKWDEGMFMGRVCIQRDSGENCVSDVGSPFFIGDTLYGLQSFGQIEACEDGQPNGIQDVRFNAGWINIIAGP